MSSRIFKYVMPIQHEVILELPNSFRPLHVGEQDGRLCLWALVNPSSPSCRRRFFIYGTGQEVDHTSTQLFKAEYIGTVQMSNGLVWHVTYAEPTE